MNNTQPIRYEAMETPVGWYVVDTRTSRFVTPYPSTQADAERIAAKLNLPKAA